MTACATSEAARIGITVPLEFSRRFSPVAKFRSQLDQLRRLDRQRRGPVLMQSSRRRSIGHLPCLLATSSNLMAVPRVFIYFKALACGRMPSYNAYTVYTPSSH